MKKKRKENDLDFTLNKTVSEIIITGESERTTKANFHPRENPKQIIFFENKFFQTNFELPITKQAIVVASISTTDPNLSPIPF